MKENAMNLMLAVVRVLRSQGDSVSEINRKMKLAMNAYNMGEYAKAIERATMVS